MTGAMGGRLCIAGLFVLASLASLTARAQFDGDGVRYRNIALEELPAVLAGSPDALLLDVRSPGEFNDTATWAGMNIGHLRNAISINFKDVPERLDEIGRDRDRPIIVYCSHSQRSRRVGNMLADSGYTRVMNVNAGLSRYWLEQDRLAGIDALLVRSTRYGILNARRLCELREKGPVCFLDVRPDTLLLAERRPERVNAMGAINGAQHIPITVLHKRMQEITRDSPIVVLDEGGGDAPRAADMLLQAGFEEVHVLYDGMASLLSLGEVRFPCRTRIWTAAAPYAVVPLSDLDTAAIRNGLYTVIDVRFDNEYHERVAQGLRGMNRFRGAVHVPADQLVTRMEGIAPGRTSRILLVGDMSGGPVLQAARDLCDMGYTQVHTLAGGIWGLRWAIHNLDGYGSWRAWLIDE